MTENIVELFLENAHKYPDKPAIIHKNDVVTYKMLENSVKEYAAYFTEKGIKYGDRVLIFVPMSVELYKILAAIFYIGAAAVFVDAWTNKKRLEQALNIVPCSAFIGTPKAFLLKLFSDKIKNIPINIISGKKFHKKINNYPQMCKVKPDDTMLITFTTGSTGIPKAAKRTSEFLLNQHYVLKKHLNTSPEDVDLTCLPIFVLHNLASGAVSVIPDFNPQLPSEIQPEKILRDIKKYNINTSCASPKFYEKLAKYSAVEGLKRIYTGGAPVFPKLAKFFIERFKNCEVSIIYGSTEAEPISSVKAQELISKEHIKNGLYAGKPAEDIKIKIIKPVDGIIDDFEKVWLKNDEVGEICVTGKAVLKEYFNSKEAQMYNKIKYNGEIWHRTGDAGFITDNGELYLTGRVKERFEYNGRDIYVFPVENQLLDIDGIEIGTILKHKDKIKLVVETKSDKNTIINKIKESGIYFDEIIFLKKIPRDPRHNSKIDYDKLKLNL